MAIQKQKAAASRIRRRLKSHREDNRQDLRSSFKSHFADHSDGTNANKRQESFVRYVNSEMYQLTLNRKP